MGACTAARGGVASASGSFRRSVASPLRRPAARAPRRLAGEAPAPRAVAAAPPPPPTPSAPSQQFFPAYELVQGADVRWSHLDTSGAAPPTAVLLHGILGSRRNLLSFAKRLAAEYPAWQFVLVDLRCHGASASNGGAPAPHSVAEAAHDVLRLLGALKLFPHALIGHSFGGKVAMSMVHEFGRRLPRPVQVWVLDTVPGDVYTDGGDHPADVISFVQTIQMPLGTRRELVDALTGQGFTLAGAQWMTTNLAPVAPGDNRLTWTFDITGIAQMYRSYEATDLWPLVEKPPQGAMIDFVRAELSAFKWTLADEQRIRDTGANVHFLSDSAHWVHVDNPDGLLDILRPSFERFGFGN